jgi:hypothetical protein
VPHPKFDPHEWSQVELLIDATKGTGRMAVAQPPGTKAFEVLDFSDPTAGHGGPIAWQMHNQGLFDEYRNIVIEPGPKDDRLITAEFPPPPSQPIHRIHRIPARRGPDLNVPIDVAILIIRRNILPAHRR